MPIERPEQMPMVRVFFSKTGRAKYISHLDIMRMFTRALRRSGLPLWYTQGFNPHLYMTFALPLPLGTEGLRESVDLRLTEEMPFDEVAARIDAALPPGFAVSEAATPAHKPEDIKWADYAVALTGAGEVATCLEAFVSQPVIEVIKRTKKGEKTIDIRPLTALLAHRAEGDALELRLRCAAGIHLNIAPTLPLEALTAFARSAPGSTRIVREAILLEDLQPFA